MKKDNQYSPCHCLEGTKDALCNKFGTFRIGQICRPMCTQTRVVIETHSRMDGAKHHAFKR